MVALNYSAGSLVAFTIAVACISTTAIILRFWSRAVQPRAVLGWDDWAALAALPLAIVMDALIVDSWHRGLGEHIADIAPADTQLMLKDLFAGSIAFNLSITLSKASALAFYGRVFRVRSNPSRVWRACYWAVLALALAWPLATVPDTVAICSPVAKYWDSSLPGNCSGLLSNFASTTISSVVIDIFILLLPLPQIFLLKMEVAKKLLVAGIFIVGYSAAFMSIGRMVTASAVSDQMTQDITHAMVPILFWSVAECGLSILAICLPSIFQLLKRCHDFGPASLATSREMAARGSRYHGAKSKSNWYLHGPDRRHSKGSRMIRSLGLHSSTGSSDDYAHGGNYNTFIWGGGSGRELEPLRLPTETIHIRRDVTIVDEV